MHQRWLSLPLLSSCVAAFYPYDGDNSGSNHNGKRFYPVAQPQWTQDDSSVVSIGIKKMRRDNTFPVVPSKQPSNPNAIAIDQDGADFSYFSTAKFGSKGQEMHMLIDTGSANTWVMGSDCKTDSCSIHNTFGSGDSDTLKTSKNSWQLSYGTGSVEGVVATDKVTFASFTLNFQFGLASSASKDFNNYPMDGIMGLGPSPSNDLGVPTIMEALDKQSNLKDNIVGIHLQRSSDGTNDGMLTFGGIDNSKFSGKLSYTATTDDNVWKIPVDDVFVGGSACKFSSKSAIIDTGTSYILVPPGDASTIHGLIPGSSHNGESYTVPCGSSTSLHVSFSGIKYTISAKDYVGKASGGACASNIIGHQAYGPNEWILGDTFLKNVYTVFDFDKNRIGFGTMGDSSASSTSSTGSSSSSAGSSTSPSDSPSSTTTPASSGVSGSASSTSTSTSSNSSEGGSTTDGSSGSSSGGGSGSSSSPTSGSSSAAGSSTSSSSNSSANSGSSLEVQQSMFVMSLVSLTAILGAYML